MKKVSNLLTSPLDLWMMLILLEKHINLTSARDAVFIAVRKIKFQTSKRNTFSRSGLR